jgi:hypothetical protein
VLKGQAVAALSTLGWDIALAVDDEPMVADAYERAGVPCFRAAFAGG